MADVFLAEDQQLGRKVALKLLHHRFAEDPRFIERFRREAQAAAGLQHPNVVAVYDRGSYDGTYYIVMEYLPGRSLKQLIGLEAPLDPVRAIEITVQILKAARFAHRRGVIHRDIKPHNVIVDDSDQATVTDFGIARAGGSDMTETGSIVGTAQYLSPEQAQGHAVSPASDLYAIGVVLYEMLTGRVPFDAKAAVTIALKHVSESPPPPSAVNPSVPPELEQAVLWALTKNPADRPAEAGQFIAALEQAKAAILSPTRAQRTASTAALAAVAVAVPAAAAPFPPPPITTLPEPAEDGVAPAETEPPMPPESRRRRRWPWALPVLALLLFVGGGAVAYLLTRPLKDTVPTVVGEKVGVAQTQVLNAGLTPNRQYRTASQAAGIVISQYPLGEARAIAGSTVTLTVSQGPGNAIVPPVDQDSEQTAKQLIAHAVLNVETVLHEASSTVPAGEATRTDPPAGTSLPRGSSVILYMSSGQPLVTVPDVMGQTEIQANATLANQGFRIQATTQPSRSAAPYTVISQSPSGGSLAAPGSSVTIIIATSPPRSTTSSTTTSTPTSTSATVAVPGVVGDTAGAANGALRAAGFHVSRENLDTTNPIQDGEVISQSPPTGTIQSNGSTVTIIVGHYKAPTHTTTTNTQTTTSSNPTTTSSNPTTTSSNPTTTSSNSTTTSSNSTTTSSNSTTTSGST